MEGDPINTPIKIRISSFMNIFNSIRIWLDNFLRRIFDMFVTIFALLLLWPLFVFIALLIKKDSRGPIFYTGKRAGKKGKIFNIIKFRTMVESPESYEGHKITAQDDVRITPIGRILRETKLNELPQLLNVLFGHMSLVGPRPEDPDIVNGWNEKIRNEILSVKPGITSPASIVYRNEEQLLSSNNIMDQYLWNILPSKLRMDQLYIRNRNILNDLDVIFLTVLALVPLLNKIEIQENLLFQGPLSLLFRRYVRWFIVDFVVAFISVSTAGILRRLSSPLDIGVWISMGIALLISLLFSLVNTFLGINRTEWSKASPGDVMNLAGSTGIVTIILFVGNQFMPIGLYLPPIVLVTTSMFAFIGFTLVRYRGRLLTAFASRWINIRDVDGKRLGESVIIIGAGDAANIGITLMRTGLLSRAFNIVGLVDDDPKKIGSKIDGVMVLGPISSAENLIRKYDVGIVLFAIEDISISVSENIIDLCQKKNTRIIMLRDIMDNLISFFPIDKIDENKYKQKLIDNNTKDRLTGVLNQYAFLSEVRSEMLRYSRYNHVCSLIRFQVNCKWPEGINHKRNICSQVIREIIMETSKLIRLVDIIGRYDNNSFVILLPETDQLGAKITATRIYKELSSKIINTDLGAIAIEISIGYSTQDSNESDAEALINSATESMRMELP